MCDNSGAIPLTLAICALLEYYAASSDNPLPTFRGTTYRSHLQGSSFSSWTSRPLKIGPIRCPETSVKDYHLTLRNIADERRSHQRRGGLIISQNVTCFTSTTVINVWRVRLQTYTETHVGLTYVVDIVAVKLLLLNIRRWLRH